MLNGHSIYICLQLTYTVNQFNNIRKCNVTASVEIIIKSTTDKVTSCLFIIQCLLNVGIQQNTQNKSSLLQSTP